MSLLEIDGLIWEAHGVRRRLSPDPLKLNENKAAVVVARDSEEGEAFTDVLLGLAEPVAGRILLDGEDITGMPTAEREIGLVPAGGGLLPHLTIRRNLELAAQARRELAPLSHGRVGFVSKRLHIDGRMDDKPHQLGHEDRLTVALARVLCRPVTTKVVVIEDRTGVEPCHGAVNRALSEDHRLTVLIVTDDRTRVASLASSSDLLEITDADQS
ncbi:ATP-binding cassette domain-containing protein [Nonomuraea sp. NPDC049309]|uniref:ATP-binding cassette domain-containing protein n=1 Tax=Nonomuraea sp. NPDC049309 TaxID=3364350 RepID=UPI003720BD32